MTKTEKINTVNTPNFVTDFDPQTDAEKLYLGELISLIDAKKISDWETVGLMVGISADYAKKSFGRVGGKYHDKVVRALRTVIENRNNLINQYS